MAEPRNTQPLGTALSPGTDLPRGPLARHGFGIRVPPTRTGRRPGPHLLPGCQPRRQANLAHLRRPDCTRAASRTVLPKVPAPRPNPKQDLRTDTPAHLAGL